MIAPPPPPVYCPTYLRPAPTVDSYPASAAQIAAENKIPVQVLLTFSGRKI